MPTVQSLRASLVQLGCSPSGNKDALRQRLRKARRSAAAAPATDAPLEAAASLASPAERAWVPAIHTFLVTDIEATCERNRHSPPESANSELFKRTLPGFDYPNEIIELPVVVLQWRQDIRRYEEIARFHRFVKPLWRPQLSTFCTQLTGLEQAAIDQAPEWPVVLWGLFEWLNSLGLLEQRSRHDSPDKFRLAEGVCWATHGPEDLASFVPKQSWIAAEALDMLPGFGSRGTRGLPPLWLRGPLLDIRKAFCHLSRLSSERGAPRFVRRDLTIAGILRQLGMDFEGRPHSGMCDTENLVRILIDMANRVRDAGNLSPIQNALCDTSTPDGLPGKEAGTAQSTVEIHTTLPNNESASSANCVSQEENDVKELAAALQNAHLTPSPPPEIVNSVHATANVSTLPTLLAPLRVSTKEAEAVLKANVDHSTFGNAPYWWMKRPGKVDWPHPPEP